MSKQSEQEGILNLGVAAILNKNAESELQSVLAALAGQVVGEVTASREALEGIAENNYLRARVELAKSFILKSQTNTGLVFHVQEFEKCWDIISGEEQKAEQTN